MRRRVLCGLLLGISSFLLVFAFALAFVLAPLLARIPIAMKPSFTSTVASDATFVQVKGTGTVPSVELARAGLRVTTRIRPDVPETTSLTGHLAGRTVVWNVFQKTERTDNGGLVTASISRIALDRRSAAAVDWSGQCLADQPLQSCAQGSILFGGQLYQFPFGTQKKTYVFYDSNLGRGIPISYRGTDTVKGLRAYRFEQVISERPLRVSPAAITLLTGRFAPGATTGRLMYRTHRTVWVEPVSGVIVGVEDQQHHTLVPDTGLPTVIFDATLRLSPETVRSVTADARSGRTRILALGRYVPLGLALLGLAGLGLGYRLTRRTPNGQQPPESVTAVQ